MTEAVREGFHSVTPIFMFKDTRKAIAAFAGMSGK